MGIFGALSTAISGLRAQATALEHVSGNIANSQTTGFKRTETRFVDYVPDAPPSAQAAQGVSAFSRSTNDVQGEIQRSDISTHMALNGDGYFVVEKSIGRVDNRPIFQGGGLYTRRGDFEVDRDGYLVNGAGYFLKGLSVDSATGNVSGTNPEVIRISNDFLPAQATSNVAYRGNLPTFPLTRLADANVPGSELLDPAAFTTDPTVAGAGYVEASDEADFLDQSIAGQAITVYDPGGNPVNLQLRWAKIDSAATGGADTWNLFYLENANATGTDAMWRNAGEDYTFNGNGQLDPAVNDVPLTGVTVNGVALGDINIQHGPGGVTQFGDADGAVQVKELTQNGFAAGEMIGIAVTDRGRIRAAYTNGQSVDIAEISLASFNADNQLKKLDGGAFQETEESGFPIFGAQSSILGAALENSNTDVAEEFSKLIVTQQAYAAGTRIVTTSNDMLQEALNMIR